MNATQTCVNNQYTIAIISILNHKSVSHSINQLKPHHNNHTKNALSIHQTIRKSIHQDNHVTIPFEPMDRSDVSEHCRPSWELNLRIWNLCIFIFSSFHGFTNMYSPYTQPARVRTHPIHRQPTYCTHPIHRQPVYASENRVSELPKL
jgi:hypothetical protein